MRQRITVQDAKAARIPNVLNIPASDPRFLAFLNEAIERLIYRDSLPLLGLQ